MIYVKINAKQYMLLGIFYRGWMMADIGWAITNVDAIKIKIMCIEPDSAYLC